MTASDAGAWPLEIRVLRAEQALEVDFDDGTTLPLPGRAAARREPVGRGAGPLGRRRR